MHEHVHVYNVVVRGAVYIYIFGVSEEERERKGPRAWTGGDP